MMRFTRQSGGRHQQNRRWPRHRAGHRAAARRQWVWMVVLLPDRMTQRVVTVPVGVDRLRMVHLRMVMHHLLVARAILYLFDFLVCLILARLQRRRLIRHHQRLLGRWRRWRRRRGHQLTRPRTLGASQGALVLLIDAVHLVPAPRPNLVILVAVVEAHSVHRLCVESRDRWTVQSGVGTAQGVIDAVVVPVAGDAVARWTGVVVVVGAGVGVGCCRRWIHSLGITAVRVSVKATPHQGVGRHVAFAYERVTLEDLDAGGTSQNGGEQRRMIGTWGARERRVERQEARGGGVAVATLDVPHRGAVVQRLDGEEPRDLFAMLVDVLQQKAVAPDAQPRVDTASAHRTLLRIQLLEGLLNAEQALLAGVRHGAAQIEHPTPTVWRCHILICTAHI